MYWLLLLLCLCISCLLFYLYFKEKQKNKEISSINEKIIIENKEIENRNKDLLNEQNDIQKNIEQKQQTLNQIAQSIENSEQISKKAFENYIDILDTEYSNKEKEYQQSLELLNESYGEIQNKLIAETDRIREDLDKISTTRAAAIQAQLEEEKIQQQSEYYSLSIDNIDKREVKILQSIENELRDPRPIRMIIWQTYYSKKANDLAARVLGPNEKCGIYKITNKNNKLCYIGQSKKIRERWREHMKCGLGIDTPAANKLYQAMIKEGIDNFTFELLEECPSQLLDEKETFYISLYNSYDYGYNSNRGNKKV